MNRQERARLIASLTDDELRQLRERAADTDAPGDADRQFARNLFSGSDDNSGAGNEQHQGSSEYSEEQRRWARELFAPDDADAVVFAGLVAGRTVGRTTPPRT